MNQTQNQSSSRTSSAILEARSLSKEYTMGEIKVAAVRDISFSLFEGEFVVILGPSGSGKSTILNIVGGIDQASGGELFYRGRAMHTAGEKELTLYRRRSIGFVFQFYNLIPNLTARENIALAAELSDDPFSADELLARVGLSDRADHFPSKLSGGEQQRIALARALAKNPDILLCDEPTGALDFQTGIQVLRILKDFNSNYGKTVVIITHNAGIARMADRVLYIRDGLLDRLEIVEQPVPPEEVSW